MTDVSGAWRTIAILAVGIAAGMGVGMVAFRHDDSGPTSADRSGDLDRIEADLRALRTAQATPDVVDVRPADAGTAAATEIAELVPTQPPPIVLTPEAADQFAFEEARARADAVVEVLATQAASGANETRIRAGIQTYRASHPGAADLSYLRCSVAICELRLLHVDPDAGHALATGLMAEPGFSGEGLLLRRPTASGFETTYLIGQSDSPLPR